MHTNINEAISMAKLRLAVHPQTQFLFALCCRLVTKVTTQIDTAATNGVDLLINPSFFNSLDKDEQVFLLAHETLHVAYLHVLRRDDRDPVKFNCACDYVINSHLVERNFKLIDGGLYDKKYYGMSSEEVYDLLDDIPNNPIGNDIISTDIDAEIAQEATQNVISAVHSAEQSCATDSIPNDVKRFMDNLRNPKINWRVVLKRFLLEMDKTDFSWKKPNRRHLHRGSYMPSLYDNNLTKITFAIDVSGSISDDLFNQFITEVKNVFNQMKPKQIQLIQFHHEIASIHKITSINDFNKIAFTETGGTNLAPVMNYMKKDNSKALVVITDGYFDANYAKLSIPTLWAVYDNRLFKPLFGQSLFFTLD